MVKQVKDAAFQVLLYNKIKTARHRSNQRKSHGAVVGESVVVCSVAGFVVDTTALVTVTRVEEVAVEYEH